MTDSILRIYRDENFKRIYLKPITDEPDLSWKAKGIHTYLITRPDGWEFNRQDIINRASDGRTAVKSGLEELEEKGYLVIENFQKDNGKWTSKWLVAEDPDMLGKQSVAQNPLSDNSLSDNVPHSSKEVSSKEDSSTTEQSSQGDKLDLDYDDPSKHTPKDLVKIFNATLNAEQDYVRETINWGEDIGIISNVRKKFDGSSAETKEFLEWIARRKFNELQTKNTNLDKLGFLFSYVNDFKNWRKKRARQEELEKQIEAGAPDPDESVESMQDARDIMG